MNYLALGDSYTIGEGLAIWDSFPYIFVQKVRKSNKEMNGAEIVAKTGYTSKELLEVVRKYKFNNIKYDLVSVLIGVNNIYRKLEIEEFKKEFKELLEVAQKLGKQVIVLSIPDYGATPFAKDKNEDLQKIGKITDEYNSYCEQMAKQYNLKYINITEQSRQTKNYLEDKIHLPTEYYEFVASQLLMQLE